MVRVFLLFSKACLIYLVNPYKRSKYPKHFRRFEKVEGFVSEISNFWGGVLMRGVLLTPGIVDIIYLFDVRSSVGNGRVGPGGSKKSVDRVVGNPFLISNTGAHELL